MEPSEIVRAYLTAFTSGDVDRAASLVSEDFSFQGPSQATEGRSALRKIVAHVAAGARGHRIVRQWQDGDDVCTLYEIRAHSGARETSLLVSEWNTVRDGQVASSLMVFDTGPFRGADGLARAMPVASPATAISQEPAG